MLLLADMLFRRSASKTEGQDVPVARPRTKTARSPRARLRDDAWSMLR